MKKTTAILAAMAMFAPSGAFAQTMFKCVQGENTVYQAEPCPETAKQDKLKAPPPPPPSAGKSGGAGSADVDRMIEFMSTYRACADGVSIWGQEMAAPYKEWRTRNAAMVSRIESDRQLQTRFKQRVEAKRNGKASMCRDVALELRGKK